MTMNFTVMHGRTKDGRPVNSVVELVDMENLDLARWQSSTRVNYMLVCRSYHRTQDEAKTMCIRMHKRFVNMK